jgi:WhiB family transcriptional regulator, redox-sensing transcriptional regulator
MRPADWRDDAGCLDADPDLFFPVGTAGPALRQIEEAKRICRTCPAQDRCLAWALDTRVASGVWGGTTEDEDFRRGRRWVTVAALTPQQFADLARITRLAETLGFLERLLDADFSARGDLRANRAAIGVLLAPWFARHTLSDLTGQLRPEIPHCGHTRIGSGGAV